MGTSEKHLKQSQTPASLDITPEDQLLKSQLDALENLVNNACKIFKPPERIKVSEWADKYRYMSSEETSRPGPWRTSIVPYLAKIMDCLNDDDIEKVIFLKPTQIGGTEAGINIVGYIIDQQPSRILYVLPDEDTMRDFSSQRLQKVLRTNECFKDKYREDSKDLMLSFHGGFCKFGNASSATKLASWSVPVIILDEIDKYPKQASKEASPLKLAEERTKNWPGKRKMFFWSTPTLKTGNIWQLWENADMRFEFQVPCPFCGHYQALEWNQVRFNVDEDVTAIQYNTHYECCSCGGHITDQYKPEMLEKGRWVALNEINGKPKSVAFKLNSLYSPWVTFGQMAAEFIRSKDDQLLLMNFVNSWLGEPWESKSAVMEADLLLQHKTDVPMGVVPDWAQLLTGGVDVQMGYFYWKIDAWGPGVTCQTIAYGRALTLDEIEKIMDTWYPDKNGKPKLQVWVYGIDTGYRTEEIYDYCERHPRVAIPVKGSSTPMVQRARPSNIERKDKLNKVPLQLWIVNTDTYKNEIAMRMEIPIGKGSWMLNADCDREFAEQITSEHRVIQTKGGRTVETWEKKTSAKQNHWLDCSVYSFAVADLVHMRQLQEDEPQALEQAEEFDGMALPEPGFSL